MLINRINFWYISSFFISILVALPIITVFYGFFESTSDYFLILKNNSVTNPLMFYYEKVRSCALPLIRYAQIIKQIMTHIESIGVA